MPLLSDTTISLRALDANGDPVSGALLRVYEAGTTTEVSVYSDEALTVTHSKVANAAGVFDPVYVVADTVKVALKDPDTSADLPGYPIDNFVVGLETSGKLYKDYPALAASTEASRGTGALWHAGQFTYIEVETGEDFTTAGGVKLAETGTTFSTRARFVKAVSRGDNFQVGHVVFAENLKYTYDSTSTAISDLPGFNLAGSTLHEDPSTNDWIAAGDIVEITSNAGIVDTYVARKSFQWSDVIAHVFDTAANATLRKMSSTVLRTGQIVMPTGHTAPADFDIYYAGDGRFVTSVDKKEDYRAQFQPAYTQIYYVDNVNGSDANNGLSRATAKATFAAARGLVNANGDGVVCLIHAGKAYDKSDGITHTSSITVSHSVIGLPDEHGNGPFISNAWAPSDFTFSANATYPWVFESSTSDDDISRICDISVLETIFLDWATGRSVKVPTLYKAKSSLQEVSEENGSYWNDTASNILYVNTLDGDSPTVSEDIVLPRSDTDAVLGGSGAHADVYLQDLTVIDDIKGPGLGNIFWNECVNCYSQNNGFQSENIDNFGTRYCVAIEAATDGFNYHNIGTTVSGVTQANPGVVTANNHNLANGDLVMLSGIVGMTEVNDIQFSVSNVTTNTFELTGIDTSGYTAYSSGGKARRPAPRFHALYPATYYSGNTDSSHQSSSAHENCEGVTVMPLFKGAYREPITDIDTVKHLICGGYIGGTQIPASSGANNRIVQATDTADIALLSVRWGGYTDPGITLFTAAAGASIRVAGTDLPYDATQHTGVTATW